MLLPQRFETGRLLKFWFLVGRIIVQPLKIIALRLKWFRAMEINRRR